MTILIRELVIKAEVTEKKARGNASAETDSKPAKEERTAKFSDLGLKQRRER